eukprot:CAMPEP_0168767922 /NCGR_PEP_ID=MMETSP0725-20121227/1611_1 /TAXON_ID=265536 /ORGANISM="Amphiprora sp., Strain CCMP467" /LENGTH=236 /DNA_ID=CAMNT_0008817265 /DNA_START=34 /DNA_END=743 /DNA_ORIENTATION=+
MFQVATPAAAYQLGLQRFSMSLDSSSTNATNPFAAVRVRSVISSPSNYTSPTELSPWRNGCDLWTCRGKKCFLHVGNERFRQKIASMLSVYEQAETKVEKTKVLNTVVEQVRRESPGGGFVKQDDQTGRWYEVGDFLAREKTSQTFRDALHKKYKSSNVAKRIKRKEEKESSEKRRASESSVDIEARIKSLSSEIENCSDDEVHNLFNRTNTAILTDLHTVSRKRQRKSYSSSQSV